MIVGQGISATLLSWFLLKSGAEVTVVDDQQTATASRVAAGLINPVTGRRLVTVWMDQQLLPFAEDTYTEIDAYLDIRSFVRTRILNMFANPFMKEGFLKRIGEKAPYLSVVPDQEQELAPYFNYEFGSGSITPAYQVHTNLLLSAWRQQLIRENRLIQEAFHFEQLELQDGKVRYGSLAADLLIFCDGASGNSNPFFSLLPFALNKGEALIIECPDLPQGPIYKKSITLAPLGEGRFWAGSNYIWDFDDEAPTADFRKATESHLRQWLKLPFTVRDHQAAIRPATVERRPFVGFHPRFKQVGILNGMGTKGCSLAPWFARQLADHILHQQPLAPEADISRFSSILSRTVR
ncbi:FAD-dependent oxidoreductase [Niabella terrae]